MRHGLHSITRMKVGVPWGPVGRQFQVSVASSHSSVQYQALHQGSSPNSGGSEQVSTTSGVVSDSSESGLSSTSAWEASIEDVSPT